MRLNELNGRQPLYEKINRPPLSNKIYLTLRLKEIKAIYARLISTKERLKSALPAGEKMFETLMRYEDFRIYDIERLLRSSQIEDIEDIIRCIENVFAYGGDRAHGYNFWTHLTNAIKRDFSEHPDPAVLATFDQQAVDYGFAPDDEDEEYRGAREIKASGLDAIDCYVKLEAILVDMRPKIGELLKIMGSYDKYRPDHEEEEILYHASCFCTEILRDGFLSEPPEERRGLGNFGNQKLISFTFSSKIAHDIAKCMKEVWMIAHDQLTAKDILKWMVAEKMDIAAIEQSVGLGVETGEDHPLFGKGTRRRLIAEMTDPEMVAKLYRTYLAFSAIRTDPCFCFIDRLVETMRTRKIEDIGILKALVNLTKEHDYMYGEAEFRLPASDVVKIERLS